MQILEEITSEEDFLSEGFVRQNWKFGDLHVFISESKTLLVKPIFEGRYKIFSIYNN